MTGRTGLGFVLVATAALIALAAGGCGASKNPAVANVGPTPPSMMQKLLAFSTCMRAHGEPSFPDPLPTGGYSRSRVSGLDPKSPHYVVAMSACRSGATAIGMIHTQAQQQQRLEQLNAEDACIRKHGVPSWPGPTAQGVQPAPQGDVDQARLEAAEKVCAYLNP